MFEYWHVKKASSTELVRLHIAVNSFRSEVYHKPVWVVSHCPWNVAVVWHLRRGDTPAIPGCAFLWFPGGLSALQRLPATSWRVPSGKSWLVEQQSHTHDHPFTVHGILNGQVPRSPHLKSLKFSIGTLEFVQTFADGVKNLKAHFHSCNIFFFL